MENSRSCRLDICILKWLKLRLDILTAKKDAPIGHKKRNMYHDTKNFYDFENVKAPSVHTFQVQVLWSIR